jgi:hypothetical protein
MALANVAWILAANGKRVLAVRLGSRVPRAAPVLHALPRADVLTQKGGVIDLIRTFERETTNLVDRSPDWLEELARVGNYAFALDWSFPGGGRLDFLTAGRQNRGLRRHPLRHELGRLLRPLGCGQFFDALREDMQSSYDYTLIDSRTGFSDVADICTVHLPDILVDCFTYNEQGIDGSSDVARKIGERYGSRGIRNPAGPHAESRTPRSSSWMPPALLLSSASQVCGRRERCGAGRLLHDIHVPYQPFYAFEETLATFGDLPGNARIAPQRIRGPDGSDHAGPGDPHAGDGRVRPEAHRLRFHRQPPIVEDEIVLDHEPNDLVMGGVDPAPVALGRWWRVLELDRTVGAVPAGASGCSLCHSPVRMRAGTHWVGRNCGGRHSPFTSPMCFPSGMCRWRIPRT